jgi:MOSC domain-containing protein YiiM
VDSETLELMDLQPGSIQENITTRGINISGLPVGQKLRVGEAQLEVGMACTPCDLLEKIRPGLRRERRGRHGRLCRVITLWMIWRGDTIERIS